MKRINPFKGLGVALVTPFLEDGSVDFKSLRALVSKMIGEGADFICVLGTTAETPCLTGEEKRAVMDAVVDEAAGRVPLLLGCGGNCTASVCDYLKTADLKGFSGVLIVAPFYNKPSQNGLFEHFKAVAAASPLPVVVYNVPGRTGVNISAETTLRIAHECANVVAIKEASGKIGQIEDIIDSAPEGFDVLSGDDAITFELLTIGAAGVISVVGNAFPKDFGNMVHSALEGDFNTALAEHKHFKPLYPMLSVDGNPSGIKSLLSLMGLAGGTLRLPLVPVREDTRAALQKFLDEK